MIKNNHIKNNLSRKCVDNFYIKNSKVRWYSSCSTDLGRSIAVVTPDIRIIGVVSPVYGIPTSHKVQSVNNQQYNINSIDRIIQFPRNRNKTRAPRGTDCSPEYNEHFCYKLYSRVKNLTSEWNQKKKQHFLSHASRSLLCIRFPRGSPGFKSRMCPPYPQRDRKRRLIGAVCRNHRIKRVLPCRC